MEKQDAVTLFHSMHPDFFEREYIRSILEDWIFEEMLLPLENFDPGRYEKSFDSSVTFSYFQGNRDELLKIVEQVNSDWPAFFGGEDRVLCGYLNGKVVSFCIVEDMGTHMVNGQALKIGGPGCVGTLPEYRDKGIGLTMVKKATQILKDEGYNYSYIHYTGVAQWYAKLGYETILKWTRNGIL
ncbi:MAG: GNAT family N-acetyltransferase [Lachnospiraceae bacterium]|nr:GNAT family N-acetyltransferase [Lachnospiraceae bacterium]